MSKSASPSGAASQAPSFDSSMVDQVCQAGIQEGSLSVWIRIDPDQWAAEIKPFTDKYPGIKVTENNIQPTESAPRIITDVSAGKAPEADIVQGEAPLLQPLVDRGLIDTTIDWTHLGQSPDLILNNMVRHYRVFRGLGYNTNTVQASDLPDTWEGLIDPKWAGEVVVDPRGYLFQDLAVQWGTQKTLDYVNRLWTTDKPLVIKGITDGSVAVASGQAKLTSNLRDAEAAEQQAKGAPIKLKYLDLVPLDDSYVAVTKGAQHPNAAQCMINYLNSDQGLQLQFEQEYKKNDNANPDIPASATLIHIDTPEAAKTDSEAATEIAKIFAGGQ